MDESVPVVPNTLLQQLSSTMQSVLTAFEQLPALKAITDIPTNPYDRLKYNLYGPQYNEIKFKTLDDVPAPENFCHNTALQNIIQTNKYINETLMHNLTCDPKLLGDMTMFNLSGDQLVPNVDRQKKQIEFIEMVTQLPINTLSNEQILEYSQKIISEYLKIHN